MKFLVFCRGTQAALLALPCLLLTTPPAALGQFLFTTNNGALTVTGYTGPGGEVVVPSETNGLPVTAVGAQAFGGQKELTSIELPGSVTNIGVNAFASCSGLTNATLGDGVVMIGDGAFEQCASLAELTIPNSTRHIGTAAFASCTALTNAALGDSVVTIGDRAFERCASLAELTIPNSTRYIGAAAFASCTALANVIVPESVAGIGAQAFFFCTSLGAITVDPLNSSYSSLDGVLFNHARTELLQYPGGKSGAYTIPGTVTRIGGCAFMQCDKLSGVVLPSSVTQIGYYAFYGCVGLTGVTIPEGVTALDFLAFSGCTGVTNFAIPASVSGIGEGVFTYCTRAEAINVAESNLNYCSIAGVLFDRDGRTLIQCPAGKTGSYTVPGTVTRIGDSAFWGCRGLMGLTIPNGVVSIDEFAFCVCTGLTELIIPESVISLGQYAFDACTNLAGVYFKGDAPIAGYELFYYANKVTAYYLPGTKGWGDTYAGRPTAWWVLPCPTILSSNLGVQANGYGLLTSWATNASIVVEACTALANAQWIPLATNGLNYGTNYFVDPGWLNYPSRFYRIRGL